MVSASQALRGNATPTGDIRQPFILRWFRNVRPAKKTATSEQVLCSISRTMMVSTTPSLRPNSASRSANCILSKPGRVRAFAELRALMSASPAKCASAKLAPSLSCTPLKLTQPNRASSKNTWSFFTPAWVLRAKRYGGFVCDLWKSRGPGALTSWSRKNVDVRTVDASTGNLPASKPVDSIGCPRGCDGAQLTERSAALTRQMWSRMVPGTSSRSRIRP
jgi:hypothetical protein